MIQIHVSTQINQTPRVPKKRMMASVVNELRRMGTYSAYNSHGMIELEAVTGYWEGVEENSVIVSYSAYSRKVSEFVDMAEALASRFGQDAVMVTIDSVSSSEFGEGIAEMFGFKPYKRVEVPATGSKSRNYTVDSEGERYAYENREDGDILVRFVEAGN